MQKEEHVLAKERQLAKGPAFTAWSTSFLGAGDGLSIPPSHIRQLTGQEVAFGCMWCIWCRRRP